MPMASGMAGAKSPHRPLTVDVIINPSDGAMVKNRWVGNYYLKADGTMATNEWVDGGKYFVDEYGKWVKGMTQ